MLPAKEWGDGSVRKHDIIHKKLFKICFWRLNQWKIAENRGKHPRGERPLAIFQSG
jgi:hypothetical protein